MTQARAVPNWDGARLTRLRELFGSAVKPLSARQLAEFLVSRGATVSAKSLTRYERNERIPEVTEAISIAEAAGVSTSWFVLGFDEAPQAAWTPQLHGATKRRR